MRILIFPPSASTSGTPRKIFFAAKTSKEVEAFALWLQTEVTDKERKKLYNLLRVCCSHSEFPLHHSPEKFKLEFDGIFALKSFQIRLFGFQEDRHFIVFHYMKKKKDKLSKSDIETINRKYEECQQ